MKLNALPHKLISSTIVATLLFSFSTSPAIAAEEKKVKPLKVYNTPKPTNQIEPEYPGKAAKRKNDGWVIVDLDIAEDGSVDKVHVQNYYGDKAFIDAAIDATKQWQYKVPKKPAKQYFSNVQVDFTKSPKGSVGSSFGRKYKKIKELIDTNKFPQALEQLQRLSFDKLDKIQEINLALSLWSTYGQKTNDKPLQLHYLSKMNLNSRRDNGQFMFAILKQKLILQLNLNQLVEAKRTFNEIKKVKAAKQFLPAFKQAIAQVDGIADGKNDITAPGRIIEGEVWRHSLARNKFSVTNIKGELTKVDLRCRQGVKSYAIDELEAVSLPKRWSDCYLDLAGETDTSFAIVEHAKGKKKKK